MEIHAFNGAAQHEQENHPRHCIRHIDRFTRR